MRFRLLVCAVCIPLSVRAQRPDTTATLLGRVVDEVDSGAVANATINVLGTRLIARSDGLGYFRIDGVRPGTRELIIRALGYARLTQSEDFAAGDRVHRDYVMTRAPHLLSEMVVHGRAMRVPHGFEEIYRRGARGWGTFITREQIDSLNPLDIKTMLATVPGVFTNDRGVYFQRCPAFWTPQLWIDGQRVTRFRKTLVSDPRDPESRDTDPYFLNEYLTGMLPADVQAIEVYASNAATPAEFLDGSGCGVIAIWTRHGP